MSAEKLKQALQEMPETGVHGFEVLAKRLLELVLNETFVLARSGDQPSGDAHNSRRNVCVQAKRYSDASLNAKNIEGDFDESLRALRNTDVYVVAVTRNTAQLDDTLNAMREEERRRCGRLGFCGGGFRLAGVVRRALGATSRLPRAECS